MPLTEITIPISDERIPSDVLRFIRDADARIAEFLMTARVPGFVPSDYESAYRLLRSLSESTLVRGRQFCEWGSGFGVVAGLAALAGFDACGIEVEGILVEEARRLMEDFDLPVEFVQGSFIPPGGEGKAHTGIFSWMSTDADHAYDDLGLDLADMDVVFAYPWPDEEGVTCELFQQYAGPGAVLATFHGGIEYRLRRKTAAKRKRR